MDRFEHDLRSDLDSLISDKKDVKSNIIVTTIMPLQNNNDPLKLIDTFCNKYHVSLENILSECDKSCNRILNIQNSHHLLVLEPIKFQVPNNNMYGNFECITVGLRLYIEVPSWCDYMNALTINYPR